jgi:uncharacterized protein YfdQ (DUF2303 family)
MTDRAHSLTVTLEDSFRIDDLEPLIAAISRMRGVLHVQPIIGDAEVFFAKEVAKQELRNALWDVLRPEWKRPK